MADTWQDREHKRQHADGAWNRPARAGWARLKGNDILVLVLLVALIVPLLAVPVTNTHWHGVKGLAMEAASVLLFGLALWRVRGLRQVVAFSARGPNPLLLSLVVLGGASYLLSPVSNRPFALQGLLQLGGGVLIYALVAHQTRARAQLELLLDGLIAVTLLMSLAGFAFFGQSGLDMASGTFGDHQLFGALLMLMLPVMLAVGFAPTTSTRRLVAQIAVVLAATGLLLARTRASWIGEGASLLILASLSYWFVARGLNLGSAGSRGQRIASWAPGLTLVAAVAAFIVLSQMGDSFGHRAQSVAAAAAGQDGSFQSRLPAWRGALAMVKARPLTGWGIGTYPLAQEPFTHLGRAATAVAAQGPSLSEEAHDFYLQLAAELGLPGLVLWLGAVTAFFVTARRALNHLSPASLRGRILIGAMAAVAGQAVDALANPAWQFSEVMLFFWITLGLGMAAAGLATDLSPKNEATPSAREVPSGPVRLRRGLKGAALGIGCIIALSQVLSITWITPAMAGYLGGGPGNNGATWTYEFYTTSSLSSRAASPLSLIHGATATVYVGRTCSGSGCAAGTTTVHAANVSSASLLDSSLKNAGTAVGSSSGVVTAKATSSSGSGTLTANISAGGSTTLSVTFH